MKWLHLGEYCYNTSFHMSIQMSPFMALYGYDAPNFLDLLFGDSRVPKAKDTLQECQDIMRSLKENLQKAQNQQKQYADQHRVRGLLRWETWCTSCYSRIDSPLSRGVEQRN